MELDELLAYSAPYLDASGFELTKKLTNRRDGRPMPFGDQQWTFTARGMDLEIIRDRSQLWVTLGLRGQTTFVYQAWARAVGIPFEDGLSLQGQVEFLTSNLPQFVSFIESHPDAGALVQRANWQLVAPTIGLDPHVPPPGSV